MDLPFKKKNNSPFGPLLLGASSPLAGRDETQITGSTVLMLAHWKVLSKPISFLLLNIMYVRSQDQFLEWSLD